MVFDTHAGRNQEYLDIAINFTMDIMRDKTVIGPFPAFLKG